MNDYAERGIDYDLKACLQYNPQSFTVDEIENVLAVWEGENDGDDWRWILSMKNGKYMFLQGGCDYTGWDCESDAWSIETETPEEAITCVTAPYSPEGTVEQIQAYLSRQLEAGKTKTWREKKDLEIGPVYGFKDIEDTLNSLSPSEYKRLVLWGSSSEEWL